MTKNIVLIGVPQSGKSTLLEKIIKEFPQTHGLLTKEIRDGMKNRIGFKMIGSIQEVIAHVNFDTDKRVSKYGVDVSLIDSVVGLTSKIDESQTVKNIRKELRIKTGKEPKALVDERFTKENILYLDEIGEMQLYSKAFKKMVKQFFDSENRVIATMSSIYECPFIDAIRKRKDVTLIEVTPQNRENLLTELVEELKK